MSKPKSVKDLSNEELHLELEQLRTKVPVQKTKPKQSRKKKTKLDKMSQSDMMKLIKNMKEEEKGDNEEIMNE